MLVEKFQYNQHEILKFDCTYVNILDCFFFKGSNKIKILDRLNTTNQRVRL